MLTRSGENFAQPGVKIRKLQITKAENFRGTYGQDMKDQNYASKYFELTGAQIGNGVYLNDNERHGYIRVDDNYFMINNVEIVYDKKAKLEFYLWISIEYGYAAAYGPNVTLIVPNMPFDDYYARTSGVPSQLSAPNSLEADNAAYKVADSSCVIATVIDPIEVITNPVPLLIGYQYQQTEDILIKETRPGMLLKDKQVRLSVTDLISEDMYFASQPQIAVLNEAESGLKLKNVHTSGYYGFAYQQSRADNRGEITLNNGTSANLTFEIDVPSTRVEGEIQITNMSVKLDRSVPETNNEYYSLIVWGTAIAENFGLGSRDEYLFEKEGRTVIHRAKFATPGDIKPYVRVKSSANDRGYMLTNVVEVQDGNPNFVVNGKEVPCPYEVPVAAYVSEASDSMMIPVRFLALALGLEEDQIVWDIKTNKVTIFVPGDRTISFTSYSSIMEVNGVAINMLNANGVPISSEVKEDRMFIPFRKLGEAFGIQVDWDPATRTAYYNRDLVRNPLIQNEFGGTGQ